MSSGAVTLVVRTQLRRLAPQSCQLAALCSRVPASLPHTSSSAQSCAGQACPAALWYYGLCHVWTLVELWQPVWLLVQGSQWEQQACAHSAVSSAQLPCTLIIVGVVMQPKTPHRRRACIACWHQVGLLHDTTIKNDDSHASHLLFC